MSKQDKPSKKAVREKKEKILEDATFGLKNKNKSSKVKQFISRVEKTVKNSQGGAEAAKAKEMKKETKLAKQLQEEELRILFNEGLTNQFGKKKSKAADTAAALGVADVNKDVQAYFDALSSDSDDSDDDPEDGVIYLPDEEPTAVEVFREKTIEDIIEEQRQKLSAEGKVGTPVTSETFAKWRAGKLLQRQAEAEAKLKAEQTKKKGGKGLSVLSGKELFSYNASLFVDDDAALDEKDEKDMALETRLAAAREEQRQKEEEERIQAEQQRLMELQQLETEVRRQKDVERRRLAALPDRPTFVMNNVIINQVVFEDDEVEDLSAFPEEKLVESIVHVAVDISAQNLNVASSSGAGEDEEEEDGENDDEDDEGDDDSEGDEEEEDDEDDEEEEDGEGSYGEEGQGDPTGKSAASTT